MLSTRAAVVVSRRDRRAVPDVKLSGGARKRPVTLAEDMFHTKIVPSYAAEATYLGGQYAMASTSSVWGSATAQRPRMG